LSFPDVNVWFALLLGDHVHHRRAAEWWRSEPDPIGYCRFTQTSILRLLTIAAATNNQPLTLAAAWAAWDRISEDDRVLFLPEPPALEEEFRRQSCFPTVSPKLWGDAYLIAFAIRAGSTFITFDRGLTDRGAECVLLCA
jgi:hypothetical protein